MQAAALTYIPLPKRSKSEISRNARLRLSTKVELPIKDGRGRLTIRLLIMLNTIWMAKRTFVDSDSVNGRPESLAIRAVSAFTNVLALWSIGVQNSGSFVLRISTARQNARRFQ
jgi:hypothetical protein